MILFGWLDGLAWRAEILIENLMVVCGRGQEQRGL